MANCPSQHQVRHIPKRPSILPVLQKIIKKGCLGCWLRTGTAIIQTDKIMVANQPNIVVIDKWDKKAVVVDVAIPSDCSIRKK